MQAECDQGEVQMVSPPNALSSEVCQVPIHSEPSFHGALQLGLNNYFPTCLKVIVMLLWSLPHPQKSLHCFACEYRL